MIAEIDSAVASGTLSINKYFDKSKYLDKSLNRARDISIKNPEASVYHAVKAQANDGVTVEIDSHSDDESAIAIPVIFDDVLDDLDW